nr:MAG TPA: hypothetical protein [Caudoviricetes sp.]
MSTLNLFFSGVTQRNLWLNKIYLIAGSSLSFLNYKIIEMLFECLIIKKIG